jgi:hypothetical protein
VVAALARTIFAEPDRPAAGVQPRDVARLLEARRPAAAQRLLAAQDDLLAYRAFPREHWTRRSSTNLLEQLNREVTRRTDVAGVFPAVPAVLRLVGAVLVELDAEWQVERRSCSLESMQLNKISSASAPVDRRPLTNPRTGRAGGLRPPGEARLRPDAPARHAPGHAPAHTRFPAGSAAPAEPGAPCRGSKCSAPWRLDGRGDAMASTSWRRQALPRVAAAHGTVTQPPGKREESEEQQWRRVSMTQNSRTDTVGASSVTTSLRPTKASSGA